MQHFKKLHESLRFLERAADLQSKVCPACSVLKISKILTIVMSDHKVVYSAITVCVCSLVP